MRITFVKVTFVKVKSCYITSLLILALLFANSVNAEITPVYGYKVINRYAHDTSAFTQGLLFHNNHLYESTGLYGESTLRQVELETGKIPRGIKLPARVFAEGLTLWDGQLIQLTWRAGVAFIFDLETLALKKQFHYTTEGWGLTHNATHLIMSDGSAKLYFRDPETFAVSHTLTVTDQGKHIEKLNELEFIEGYIYANVWMSNRIAKISPVSGKVLAWIDLTGLQPRASHTADAQGHVLNGIAYDAESQRLFVTGKKWPALYEINIIPN